MVKKFYDYETESRKKLIFPRNHFRNMCRSEFSFPFETELIQNQYKKPFDIYKYKDAKILVMGGGAHCHEGGELDKYKEGIVFYCEEKDKDEIIKQIEKIA